MAQGYGLLSADFQRNSGGNGFLQCPLCHIAFFTPNHVALSPPAPVLQYIDEYLANTEVANQLPLHEVFQLLRNAATGIEVDLPLDPTRVLPYLDLFSLVILNPTHVTGLRIPTLYLPPLSSLQNGQFRPMRTRAAISARIFDVIAAAGNTTISLGLIPLSPEQPEFNVQRYWRLPINTEIILAILINRISALSPQQSQSSEITLARRIFGRLLVQYNPDAGGSGGGSGGRGSGASGGGGGHGGGSSNNGNGAAGTSKTREKGEPKKKRPRTEKREAPNEDLGLGFFIEEKVERASDQSLSSCERPHYGVHPKEWDVATTFSMLADDKPRRAKAYFGHSTPSNRESDCGEGDHREWRFGPSFSSNMIIATARQMMNI